MINVIDLFAGCGGLSEGFEQEGDYSMLAAVEWDAAACKTLENRLRTKWNIKDAADRVLRFDIQRTDELLNGWDDPQYGTSPGLKKLIGKKQVNLIIGGPPCQAYSVAGRVRDTDGMKNDYRNYLFEGYARVVDELQPDAFVFENVPGMLSAAPGGEPIIERITNAFDEIGYKVTTKLRDHALFDVSDFGVPQRRKRLIIYGVNKKKYPNYAQHIEKFYKENMVRQKMSKKKTVRTAIQDLPKLKPLKAPVKVNGRLMSHAMPISSDISWHAPRFHSQRDISIFRELAQDVKDKTNIYSSTAHLKDLYTRITGKESSVHKYYVLREDEPSNTIVAHLYKDGLRHIHPDPEQARSITVREAARLQAFNDDFNFIGSQGDAYKMIGNAVPPLFANKVAVAVRENIF